MQKDRKNEHKKVVKYMRKFNKMLCEDEYLGINRFRIDIVSENMYRFSDGSGVELHIIFKVSDKMTGNYGLFYANNFNYDYIISKYANDFLIRCSSGRTGHYPSLNYLAYNVNIVVPYRGEIQNALNQTIAEDGIIDTYSFIN